MTRGGPVDWGLGKLLTIPHPKKDRVTKRSHTPQKGTDLW